MRSLCSMAIVENNGDDNYDITAYNGNILNFQFMAASGGPTRSLKKIVKFLQENSVSDHYLLNLRERIEQQQVELSVKFSLTALERTVLMIEMSDKYLIYDIVDESEENFTSIMNFISTPTYMKQSAWTIVLSLTHLLLIQK
jgi:hypothetical protein